jgi:hypothetical protein
MATMEGGRFLSQSEVAEKIRAEYDGLVEKLAPHLKDLQAGVLPTGELVILNSESAVATIDSIRQNLNRSFAVPPEPAVLEEIQAAIKGISEIRDKAVELGKESSV